MVHRDPVEKLETHEVFNQAPAFADNDLFTTDKALCEAVSSFGGDVHTERLSAFGRRCGAEETQEWSRLANENTPKLKSFDRWGRRLDEVEFHPAYHKLMALGLDAGSSGATWAGAEAGHLLHGAMGYLMAQADAGVGCPMSMTYACAAALRTDPTVGDEWIPRVAAQSYDQRFIPADEKTGVTIGMAMTEKQGGSDVRANTTRADSTGDGFYALTGHKWFCSAPMSDAFLVLAYAEGGLTCFLTPRWKPDGTRNDIHIMRLKDKLGDKSNASSEVEYHGAWAQRVGEEGKGVRTIIEMVQLTRYDCILGSAGGMRAALCQAINHTSYRRAFQKTLIDQPAMTAVIADLAIESEAAAAIGLRIGAALDAAEENEQEAAYARLATPAVKYWVCKRQPGFVNEALECLGGAGYVEEGPMPRLFRQSPLNAIWEGSGNVIALDILRALLKEPDSMAAVLLELEQAEGAHVLFDAHIEHIKQFLAPGELHEGRARAFAQALALGLQGAALSRVSPDFVFEAFCLQRLSPDRSGFLYGDINEGVDQARLIDRAQPQT